MTTNALSAASLLGDIELLDHVRRCASNERHATAQLIAALAEVDARRLYLGQGCSSLFIYCTQVLHLSEHAAYGRIEAARIARKFPLVLDLLADGSIHLTAVTLLAPHLTGENHAAVLAAATHKSKREVEQIVAALRPQPAVPSTIRKLPARIDALPAVETVRPSNNERADSAAKSEGRAAGRIVQTQPRVGLKPLAPERYKVQFTASQGTYDKLRTAQDLLRHAIPNGDVAAVIDRALTLLVQELRRTKCGVADRPRPSLPNAQPSGRHVPAAVRRDVWQRDGGQCAFVGAAGRCTERGFLEYHHRVPFADGGPTTVDNLELRCRAHNGYEAERWFGAEAVREAGVQDFLLA